MEKFAKSIPLITAVLATILMFSIAGWAHWGGESFPGAPKDYPMVISIIKWFCAATAIMSVWALYTIIARYRSKPLS